MPRRKRSRYQAPTLPVPEERTSEAERLRTWTGRIARARALRKHWEERFHVRELENMYLGDMGMEEAAMESQWFNHFFATIRVQLPSLFYQSPTFRAVSKETRTPWGKRDAMIIETCLQQIAAHENNLDEDGKLALLQAFFRVGVLKSCYYPAMVPNPRAGEPLDQALFVQGGAGAMVDDQGAPILQPDFLLSEELYTWEWVDARKMLFPDEGPKRRRWTWIGEEIEVTMDEAEEDTRFPSSLRKQLVPNAHVTDDFDMSSPQSYPVPNDPEDPARVDAQRFRYIECWDRRNKRLYVLAEGQPFSDEQFLVQEPYPAGIDDDPYSLLAFLPIVGGTRPLPWPLPYVYNWAPIQREYNVARRQMTNAGNRAARKVVYDQGTFANSEEARKALSSSVDMEAVEILDVTRPPMVLDGPSLNADVAASTQALIYDWRVITGASGQRLGNAEGMDTATEAALVEKGANLRDTDTQNIVINWLASAGQKMHTLLRRTLTLGMYVRMRGFGDKELGELLQTPGMQTLLSQSYGPQIAQALPQLMPLLPGLQRSFKQRFGGDHIIHVDQEQLDYDAQIEVTPQSMRARSLDGERQMWLQFLNVVGQFPQLMRSRALLEETADKFDFLSDAMIDELYLIAQQLMQEQQQQAAQQEQAKQAQQSQAFQQDLLKTAIAHPEGVPVIAGLLGNGTGGAAPHAQLPQVAREAL